MRKKRIGKKLDFYKVSIVHLNMVKGGNGEPSGLVTNDDCNGTANNSNHDDCKSETSVTRPVSNLDVCNISQFCNDSSGC